jgi:thioredoxin reductase
VEWRGRGFVAHTSAGPIHAGRVVLALGRRGTPRTLDVPGEESAKVFYRLLEPEHYAGLAVTVVGGGSAALEAALALARQPGTRVTLCHRRAEFTGARAALIEQLLAAEAQGALEVLRQARVTAVEPDRVLFDVAGAAAERPNAFVFVLIGGVPPYQTLRASGVDLEKKFGTPLFVRR